MTYKRGDVVLVWFPNSDGETVKKRPALVVQSDSIETGINQRLLALITSNLERTGVSRIFVAKETVLWQHMGLLTDSVIVTDNLATVLDRSIIRPLGYCSDMELVDAALRITLGL